MRITPLDIRKQEFRKTMRGLDADEVYAFLNTVAEEYEAVLSDNKKLRERIVDLEERLKEYKNIETNLRNTLLTAERVTSEAKENARKEASLIVRGAEVEANKAAETIRAHTQQLRREILELKRQKDNYMTRFRTLLESHHRVLDGFEEEYATVDREIEEIGKKVEADLDKGTPTRRMSREKITEEFGHAAKDKVTWGEERRREEEPRPTMPRPGFKTEASPENPFPQHEEDVHEEDMRDEQMKEAQPVSEAQTSLLPEEEVYRPNHVDVEPVGSMDEDSAGGGAPPRAEDPARAAGGPVVGGAYPRAKAPAPDAVGSKVSVDGAAPRAEAPAPATGGPEVSVGDAAEKERGSDEVRRSVARSIEKQLYPDSGEHADDTSDDGPPQAGAGVGATESEAPQQPTVRAQEDEDQWKKYEFRGEKTDWKDYDIPPAGQKQPPASKKQASKRADDSEFEEALSGLREVQKPAEEPKSQPAEKVMTLDTEVPATGGPSRRQAPPPKGQDAKKPLDSKPDQEESEWSMEDLRKNLSNFNRDEANKG